MWVFCKNLSRLGIYDFALFCLGGAVLNMMDFLLSK
jgi:hypothetical protein